jgi:hypothetical protein
MSGPGRLVEGRTLLLQNEIVRWKPVLKQIGLKLD